MDKRLFVNVQANRKISGVLRGFDIFMNLVLDDATDETNAATKTPLGTIVRRHDGCRWADDAGCAREFRVVVRLPWLQGRGLIIADWKRWRRFGDERGGLGDAFVYRSTASALCVSVARASLHVCATTR